MSDEEMAKFISGGDGWEEFLPVVTAWDAEKRETYEFLMTAAMAVELFDAGLGPMPDGVMVDYPRRTKWGM